MKSARKYVTLFVLAGLIQGCSTSSYVHDLGADYYLVESYFNPKSDADKRNAMLVLKRRAENACKGNYQIHDQLIEPDIYWGDIIVRWEISCNGKDFYQTTI